MLPASCKLFCFVFLEQRLAVQAVFIVICVAVLFHVLQFPVFGAEADTCSGIFRDTFTYDLHRPVFPVKWTDCKIILVCHALSPFVFSSPAAISDMTGSIPDYRRLLQGNQGLSPLFNSLYNCLVVVLVGISVDLSGGSGSGIQCVTLQNVLPPFNSQYPSFL